MQSKGARPPSLSGGNSFGSGNPPFANLSASYQTLLSSLAISNARFTLTMSALTVGHVYQFEWWRMETDLVVVVTTTATAGNSVTLAGTTDPAHGGPQGGPLGQFAIGTFTADAPSEQIVFTHDQLAIINAVQLRDLTLAASPAVPEPSTFALLALGGGALAGWRRWRKRKAA